VGEFDDNSYYKLSSYKWGILMQNLISWIHTSGFFYEKSYKLNFMIASWKCVLVEFVLVETVLVGDPLYSEAKIFKTFKHRRHNPNWAKLDNCIQSKFQNIKTFLWTRNFWVSLHNLDSIQINMSSVCGHPLQIVCQFAWEAISPKI
jgi:hypothetical protein